MSGCNPSLLITSQAKYVPDSEDSDDDHHREPPTKPGVPGMATQAFLAKFEEKTGVALDSDGQSSTGGSRPNSVLTRRESSEGSRPTSGASRQGASRVANSSREPPNGTNPTSVGAFSMLGIAATDLKTFQKPVERGADIIHLDDDDESLMQESDDEEAENGSIETAEETPWSGPSAAEQLAKTENENFNQHNEARARVNIKKMREVAKAKVGAMGVIGNALDKKKEMKISNETLQFAIQGISDEDWRKRKVAAYDFMDEIVVRTKVARDTDDSDAMTFYFDMVNAHIIPLFSDENWWVRKAAIRGVVKLSMEDPTPAQDAVVQAIPTSKTYKGRWTACRAAIRMYDAAKEVDKAEDAVRVKILLAMLELLADDHWIVRQEALNGMEKFANFRDVRVVSKAVSLLPHPEPKVRQVAVTAINNFMDTDGKHDAMSNKQVAEKMLQSGLAEQESFEALDDNGNGRLSAKELRAGLKDMLNVVFSVSRIKTFLGDLANKDMRFEEFINVVKSRFEELPPNKGLIQDFYEEKKMLDKETKEARRKSFRKNGQAMMGMIINDILSKLPVDFNLVPWVTQKLEVALRSERDWICKDRVLEAYIKMECLWL